MKYSRMDPVSSIQLCDDPVLALPKGSDVGQAFFNITYVMKFYSCGDFLLCGKRDAKRPKIMRPRTKVPDLSSGSPNGIHIGTTVKSYTIHSAAAVQIKNCLPNLITIKLQSSATNITVMVQANKC